MDRIENGKARSGRCLRVALTAVAVLAAALTPQVSHACAVCYGAEDSPLTEGMNNGIAVLLGVVGFVQVGFVALFLSIRRRARREQERRSRFHLIRGGVG